MRKQIILLRLADFSSLHERDFSVRRLFFATSRRGNLSVAARCMDRWFDVRCSLSPSDLHFPMLFALASVFSPSSFLFPSVAVI